MPTILECPALLANANAVLIPVRVSCTMHNGTRMAMSSPGRGMVTIRDGEKHGAFADLDAAFFHKFSLLQIMDRHWVVPSYVLLPQPGRCRGLRQPTC